MPTKPRVVSIKFVLKDENVWVEKELEDGAIIEELVGRTPNAIRDWMHKIARDDGIDLNEAMRRFMEV